LSHSWLVNFFSPTLLAELSGLMTHAEPFLPAWFSDLSEDDQKQFIALKEKHAELGWLLQSLAMHPITRAKQPYPALLLAKSVSGKFNLEDVPDSIKNVLGYREVLAAALNYGGKVLGEFRAYGVKAARKG
jgi:hypothetical protein